MFPGLETELGTYLYFRFRSVEIFMRRRWKSRRIAELICSMVVVCAEVSPWNRDLSHRWLRGVLIFIVIVRLWIHVTMDALVLMDKSTDNASTKYRILVFYEFVRKSQRNRSQMFQYWQSDWQLSWPLDRNHLGYRKPWQQQRNEHCRLSGQKTWCSLGKIFKCCRSS